MWPLECPQGISLVWPRDLVFDLRWSKFELIRDFIKTNIPAKFWVEKKTWPLEYPQGKCWQPMTDIRPPQKLTLSKLWSGELKMLIWHFPTFFWYSNGFIFLSLYHTIQTFNNSDKVALEKIVGKGENAGNQHFLLFPQCFLLFPMQTSILSHIHHVVCKCFQFGQDHNFVVW